MRNRGLIFDLDMTLVNSSSVETLRQQRRWNDVYARLNLTCPFPGICQLLLDFNSLFHIGVVTSSPRTYAEKILRYHNILLPVLVAYHDSERHKPDPEPVKLGIQRLALTKESVIAIGDEVKDVISSKGAGVKTIAVGWGKATKAELLAVGADYFASTVDELKRLLKTF